MKILILKPWKQKRKKLNAMEFGDIPGEKSNQLWIEVINHGLKNIKIK